MQHKLIYLPTTKIIFSTGRGEYALAAGLAWERLATWLDQCVHSIDDVQRIGFASELPAKGDRRDILYYAGVVLQDRWDGRLPPEIGVQVLHGGTYESLHIAASHPAAQVRFQDAYLDWLPREGLQPDSSRPVLELYREAGRAAPGHEAGVDFCIPVIPAAV